MAWLCSSRRHRPERSKVAVSDKKQPEPESTKVIARDDRSKEESVMSNGQPVYMVVLQKFEASVADELTIQRGQVVEALYCDGDWVYVRNVDGRCGYVPDSFCYPLEQMAQWGGASKGSSSPPRPCPRSINVDAAPQTRSSTTSVEVHTVNQNIQPRSSTPNFMAPAVPSQEGMSTINTMMSSASSNTPPTPRNTNRLSGLPGGRSPGNSPHLDRSTRSVHVPMRTDPYCLREDAPCSRSMVEQPTHGRSRERGRPAVQVRRSVSMNEGTSSRATARRVKVGQNRVPIHRAYSYQEAMMSVEENMYGLVAEPRLEGEGEGERENRENFDVTVRRNSSHDQSHDQSHDLASRRAQFNRMASCPSRMVNSDLHDDVFLPEAKKPLGIYRSLQSYQPRFKGEITLQQNELVILSDYGRGEWAWVITSGGTEGLIPKHLLVRYSPDLGVGGAKRCPGKSRVSDATTQTELIISAPIRQVSSASSASVGPSASSSNSSFHSSNSPTSQRRGEQSEPVGRDMASPALQTTDTATPWFENCDSLERPVKPAKIRGMEPSTTSLKPERGKDNHPKPPDMPSKPSQHCENSAKRSQHCENSAKPSQHCENSAKPSQHCNKTSKFSKALRDRPAAVASNRPNRLSCPNRLSNRPDKLTVKTRPGAVNLRQHPLRLSNTQRRHTVSSLTPTYSKPLPSPSPSILPSPGVLSLDDSHASGCDASLLHAGQSPSLTATRDYTPPPTAKNCLTIKKGDPLVSQPHMHYPRGWMWVWHSTQRTFGYIPKACVAYTYDVTKSNRQRTDSVENAV